MFVGTELLAEFAYIVVRDTVKFIFNLKDKGEKENKHKQLQERFDKLENSVLDISKLDKKVGE